MGWCFGIGFFNCIFEKTPNAYAQTRRQNAALRGGGLGRTSGSFLGLYRPRPEDYHLLLSQGQHVRMHGRGVQFPRQLRGADGGRVQRGGREQGQRQVPHRLPGKIRPPVQASVRPFHRDAAGLRRLGREEDVRPDHAGHPPAHFHLCRGRHPGAHHREGGHPKRSWADTMNEIC